MPFRDETSGGRDEEEDPLDRFAALYAALAAGSGWLTDRTALRLAAICLVSTPGRAGELALATRRHDVALSENIRWWQGVALAVRVLIAAQLVKHGDEPAAYVAEVVRVKDMMRSARLRFSGTYEFVAILVLRRVLRREITATDVARLQAIYEAMKTHHWWLTGPEDLPACAMLVARPEEPARIGAGAEAVYQALLRGADVWAGDALQTASHVLYLADVPPGEIAGRFARLMAEFRRDKIRVGQEQYDELAVLCLLAWPLEKIVTVVLEYRERLRGTITWLTRGDAFNLATNLAFVRIAGQEGTLAQLGDVKLLLDMQAAVVAQSRG